MPLSAKKRTPATGNDGGRENKTTTNKLAQTATVDKRAPSTPAEAHAAIIDSLDGQREGRGWRCRCPLHQGHSLIVSLDADVLKVHCHSCGKTRQDELIAKLKEIGLWYTPPTILMPVPEYAQPLDLIQWEAHWGKSLGKAEYVFEYFDANGQHLCTVARFAKKQFRPFTYWSNSQWRMKGPDEPKPLYGLDLLAHRPDTPVIVCEGEKTADAARSLFADHVCISWMGGVGGVEKADWSPLKGRHLVFVPDNDAPGVDAACVAAQLCLVAGAASARVAQLPESLPEGWDLADDIPQTVDLAALVNGAKPFVPKHAAFTQDFVYVTMVDAFCDLRTRDMLNVEQINREHLAMMDGRKIADILLRDKKFKRVRNVTYAPGKAVPFMEEDGQPKLNIYRPNPIAPAPGDVAPFLEYMEYMYVRTEERKIMLQWLAYLEQHPGEKILWAPLLVGARQGTGKTTMFLLALMVVGPGNGRKIAGDALKARFNGWARDVQVVSIEEVMAFGKLEIYNTLKDFVTAEMMHIEQKHVNGYDQPHRVNLILSSNHEDDAVFVEDTDRRLFVVQAPEQLHPDPQFYKRFYAWREKPESIAALRYYLRSVDLSDFPAKDHAPQTEAKRNMMKASTHPTAAWLLRKFENNEWPLARPLVNIDHLLDCLPYEHRKFTDAKLSAFLRKVLKAEPAKQQPRRPDGTKFRVWIIRDLAKWRDATPSKLFAGYDRPLTDGIYQSNLRGEREWNDPEVPEKKPKKETSF